MPYKKHVIFATVVTLFSSGEAPVLASGGKSHWGYTGHEGPAQWSKLNNDYHMCKAGKKQSPIDISNAQGTKLGNIDFNYKANPKNIVNNGHTVQVNMDKGSHIVISNKTYNLLQFHFHSPSEHTLDGKAAHMVAHFVHKAEDNQLGVVAVLMNKGKANKVIAQLWDNMPTTAGENIKLSDNINVNDILPKDKAYYNYSGSLTTPPCSEGVNWMVLKSPVQVSDRQIKIFTNIFSKSIRPVQPLHNREIKFSM